MSGYNSQSSEDDMMKTYYKMIGEAHVENIVEELSSKENEVDQVIVPKSLDKWFDSFDKKRKQMANRKKWMKRARKISSRVAVFLIILITCMTVVTMSVDAFRIRFFNFFVEEKGNYTEIEKREDESNQSIPDITQEIFFYLSYVPSGYSYKGHTIVGDIIIIQYSNKDETIIFNQSKGNANYQLDTEEAEIIEIPLEGSSGQLVLKDGRCTLFWSIDDNSFYIKGLIDEEEIIKMAENLKKNK